MLKKWLIRFSVFSLILLAPTLTLAITPNVPDIPPGQVVDLANIIDPALEQQLVQSLRELEEKTTVQMVILTITSLDSVDIESFSLQTAERWQLGQKDKDNGLLLTVSLEDKKYRFETGYGLESILPDSLLGSIGRKSMVPFFKQGDYGTGIGAATGEILAILAENNQIMINNSDQLPESLQSDDASPAMTGLILFLMVVVFIIIVMARRMNRKSHGSGAVILPGSWGSDDNFGSGSFGSGGFSGGFSGGGGGFGGGGASGGW